MPNVDNPNGFTPAYHQSGGTIRQKEYRILSGEAASIFNGDLVALGVNGGIAVSAASTPSIGVFMGCSYTAANGEIIYSPQWVGGTVTAGTAPATAWVVDDPNVVFRAQFSGASGIAQIGSTFDVLPTAGDTVTGRSRMEVDSADAVDALLRLLDFVPSPDNDSEDLNAEAFVMIAEHQLAPSATSGDIS